MKSTVGKVILTGAGCGSFDLITLRGMEALRRCDTVIYDSLIDMRLLELAPGAEKICAGKRAGQHSAKQEEINALLVEKALSGRSVVRLKGGDPFVFGRGGEEILELKKHNIPFAVIPGVTSSVAVLELAGIPVTHRRDARSFHVITGHTADSCTPENLAQYAKTPGTLVFLMGLNSLECIAEGLVSGGMSADTPAAVISNGATRFQRTVRGTLADISAKVREAGLPAPAIIVVGETAGFDFSGTYVPPLAGKNIAVISSGDTAERLCAALNSLGAYAFRAGGVDIVESFGGDVDRAFERLGEYTHIALTSPNGARIFLKKLRERRVDIRRLCEVRFAVIGKGTAAVLEEHGVFPELMPEEFSTAALGQLLAERLGENSRLAVFRSEEGSRELNAALDGQVEYDDVKIYRPVYLPAGAVECDIAAFTSSGAARGFFANGGSLSPGTSVAAIGKVTAAELGKHGYADCVIPRESTVDGVVQSILEAVKCRDSED